MALLFLATTLNYLDRQTLSILAPILQKEMHSTTSAGWLFAVFYYAYLRSLRIRVGPILDRSHLRWAFGIAVLPGPRYRCCRLSLLALSACVFAPSARRDGIGELARGHPHRRSRLWNRGNERWATASSPAGPASAP